MLISVQFNPDICFGILHLMHSKSFPGIQIVAVVGMQGWRLFQIWTVEGAVAADITQNPASSSSFSRQSSTSKAPRGRVAPARKSNGGRSSSLQAACCLTRRARIRPRTAMAPMTVHCHEFAPPTPHTCPPLNIHTLRHTTTQKARADRGCRRRRTHSTLVQWTLTGLVGG